MVRNKVLWIAPSHHECIGSGVWQLHPMLRDFQFVPTKETALVCGIRMMYHAKRIIQGVGGKTEAVALMNDGSTLHYGTANTRSSKILPPTSKNSLGNSYTPRSPTSPKNLPQPTTTAKRRLKTSPKSSSNIGTNTKSFLTTQFSNAAERLSP